MTQYIAFLRGINVGGKNRVKMVELRELLTQMGLEKVQTYIQSGNILFYSSNSKSLLTDLIEKELLKKFKFQISLVLRTFEEIEESILKLPFSNEEIDTVKSKEFETFYIAFSKELLSQNERESLLSCKLESEKCYITANTIFLLFSSSIVDSKLGRALNQLNTPITVRNWKTVKKLYTLAKEH